MMGAEEKRRKGRNISYERNKRLGKEESNLFPSNIIFSFTIIITTGN
jgi:hypothetical protein